MAKNAFNITLGHRSHADIFFQKTIQADNLMLSETETEGPGEAETESEHNSSEHPINVPCARTVALQVTDLFNKEAGTDSEYTITVEITVETKEEGE